MNEKGVSLVPMEPLLSPVWFLIVKTTGATQRETRSKKNILGWYDWVSFWLFSLGKKPIKRPPTAIRSYLKAITSLPLYFVGCRSLAWWLFVCRFAILLFYYSRVNTIGTIYFTLCCSVHEEHFQSFHFYWWVDALLAFNSTKTLTQLFNRGSDNTDKHKTPTTKSFRPMVKESDNGPMASCRWVNCTCATTPRQAIKGGKSWVLTWKVASSCDWLERKRRTLFLPSVICSSKVDEHSTRASNFSLFSS